MRILVGIALTLIVMCIVFSLPATVSADRKWWEKRDEGWFFYKDPPAPAKQQPPPPPKQEPTTKEPDRRNEPLASEVIKREGERLLSDAMVTPSEENVKAYMEHQKRALEMSERFAYIWQTLLMKYPELYISTSTEGVNEDIRRAVAQLGTRAGLFFIYSSECDPCRQSSPVVAEFRRKYNFTVIPVTLDGRVLPDLPDSRGDNGISVRLGIDRVPAWYLAYPGEDRFEHIGTGFMSLVELERRLSRYANPQEGIDRISSVRTGN